MIERAQLYTAQFCSPPHGNRQEISPANSIHAIQPRYTNQPIESKRFDHVPRVGQPSGRLRGEGRNCDGLQRGLLQTILMIFFGTGQLKSNCGQCFLIKCSLALRNMRIMDHWGVEFYLSVHVGAKYCRGWKRSWVTIGTVPVNGIINVLYNALHTSSKVQSNFISRQRCSIANVVLWRNINGQSK